MPKDFPTRCHCGQPVQRAQDHRCRQCAAHCEIARYRRENGVDLSGLPLGLVQS